MASGQSKGGGRRRGHGEGSIYQRKDGRWTGALSVGAGRRRQVYGATRREVQLKLGELQREVERGVVRSGRVTVAEFSVEWLEHVVKPERAGRTWEAYAARVRRYIVPAIGTVPITKLTPLQVQRLQSDLLREGLASATVRETMSTLRNMLNVALTWELVPRNVATLVRLPRVEREEPAPLKPEEAQRILDAFAGHRFEAAIVLALTTGLRRGEVFGLRWSDVDLEARTLRVEVALGYVPPALRKGATTELGRPKTPRSKRTIPLPERAVVALKRRRAQQAQERLLGGSRWQDTSLIFTTRKGTPFWPDTVDRALRAQLAIAGLPPVTVRGLRHGYSSISAKQGVHPKTTMQALGHTSMRTTFIYTHVDEELMREAAARMDEVLMPPTEN